MKILYNANIITLNPDQPHVNAVAISDGKILAAGELDDVQNVIDKNAEKINLEGKVVLPGLTDSHIHFLNYARFLQRIDCETDTREECLNRVGKKAKILKSGEWILGHGWNQNVWTNGFGNAAELDQQAPNHPVYLTAKSLHASWANSIALHAAGITSSTPDPSGGKIVRDEHGQPTGILLESAMSLVEKVIPPPSSAVNQQVLFQAQTALWKLGLTGVHDFDPIECFDALQSLDVEDKLRLRVVKSIPLEHLQEAVALKIHTGFGSEFLKVGSVKLFADGALGPRTAAMLQPFEGETSNAGMLFLDNEEIYEIGQKAVASGISLAVHAIGDRANHEVIKAFSSLRSFEKDSGFNHLKHRIEHVQVLHPDDFDLLQKWGIIASMQPIHATSDMFIADQHLGQRAAGAYAWNTLLKAGTSLVFGSDAPVESPNPFWGIHAAVTRSRRDGTPHKDGWYPEQRLSMHQAILAYTQGASLPAGQGNHTGIIAPGYHADLITLNEDPYLAHPKDLWQLKPSATMVAGEWVWQADN